MPLIFGCPGNGKTRVAKWASFHRCNHATVLVPGTRSNIFSYICCSGGLPLLIDDPKSKQAISNLAIALFNGATEGTIIRGQA